ncbi:MAG: caspase family protein [Myxococcaceae bacterium]
MNADRVVFTSRAEADRPGFVRLAPASALEWWKQRPPAAERFQLDELPTFDDALTLWLYVRAEAGPLHASTEALCRYADDVRQGRWPETVAVEHSPQALYLALAQETLLANQQPQRFLDDAFALFDRLAEKSAAGARLTTEPVLADVPALQRYSEALRQDERLFEDDVKRGGRYRVHLPGKASVSGAERNVSMVVLDKPVSSQFKLWARREGAALVLVAQKDGIIALSANPSERIKLGWLAEALSKRDAQPWYAGERHEGTLIASAREGSKLSLADVVSVLQRELHARKLMRPRRMAPLGLIAAITAVLAGAVLFRQAPVPAHEVPPDRGAKGEPLPKEAVLNLLGAADGPKAFESFALVAGVCSYTGDRALSAPCRDARAVRELLVHKLGYPEKNVLLFVDDPAEGEKVEGAPTAANLKLAVERFRERFGSNEQASFLFYYSGHGGYEKGARKDFGVLQASGYFDHPELPIADRGWDMQELIDDVRKGVPAKHVMLVLDACYSGWAVGAKGGLELSPELRSMWKERAEVVITAGTKGQRAWEDDEGHSVMTSFFLQGLGESGAARADGNGDGVVTDEELAQFLGDNVPRAVRDSRHAEQTPQFFRFDESLPKSGQFLFVAH